MAQYIKILNSAFIAHRTLNLARLPCLPVRPADTAAKLRVDEELALVLASPAITGQVVYTATGTLYEPSATRTPDGDYLMMFPSNTQARPTGDCHYGQQTEKVNDMLSFRSQDKGKTWQGPTIAFDIDYNQHGFIPFIPKGSKRLYAFGTQPIPGLYTIERGLYENAPIGYRYSDDDGHHWSDVTLIHPQNDPDFCGMSVMRMCETDSGTWLLGSHESDWSYNPLMTRQYVLRSPDQGQTWTLLPNPRHGGWCVYACNRMDEGRPINVGGGEIYMMIRTCEGRLWFTRSQDDGQTWSEPAPTPLIHPDAPPMLFALDDGQTLAAFHHNRYYALKDSPDAVMQDRSEIWVALSTDRGHTWSEPRFVLANAAEPNLEKGFYNWQCSYLDAFSDGGILNLFLAHRWQRCLHLQMPEEELSRLPLAKDFD